jgi:transposase
MDAIFFVLRTGCQWNALNATGLCSSSAAHRRFQEWAAAGVFLALWQHGLAEYDALQGIDWQWLAMDGAMTKAPLGGEKGREEPHRSREDRHQTQPAHRRRRRAYRPGGGGANRHDFKMARETIESIPVARPEPTADTPQGRCLDKGDDDDEVRALLAEFGFTAHIRARGEEAKALKQDAGLRARRWVVERTHSWMNRFRRVLIRWDKKVCNYLAFLHLACAYITYRQAGLLG